MYVTRRLSELQKNPKSLSETPDGPNSGYLVIKDVVEEEQPRKSSCFGLFENYTTTRMEQLPVPQNMDLNLVYRDNEKTIRTPMVFIPVLNQPLSSNTYYAIYPKGEDKGKALISSRDKDKPHYFPLPLNPQDVYQHVKIVRHYNHKFDAISAASDGIRPCHLPPKPWSAYTDTPHHFELHEARGIDSKLRNYLPKFDASTMCKSSEPDVVGKWYVPFMFVKEGKLKDQVETSMYYQVTLERRRERIFTCKKNIDDKGNSVEFDIEVETQEVFIDGNKALWSEKNAENGVIWFKTDERKGGDLRVGLRVEVVERMKWEQERGGWKAGKEWKERVKRVEEFNGNWKEFGFYVLIERFNLRRMDGTLVMAYDFKRINSTLIKWK